jgi:hypothetical protein
LDDRLGRAGAARSIRRRAEFQHLAVSAGDEHPAVGDWLFPRGGRHAAPGDADPRPVLAQFGVNAVHFGIIFTHNTEVGLVHPPVGLNLYVLSTISDAPIGEVIRGIMPFLIILLLVLGLITYWPALTVWLPNLGFAGQ